MKHVSNKKLNITKLGVIRVITGLNYLLFFIASNLTKMKFIRDYLQCQIKIRE